MRLKYVPLGAIIDDSKGFTSDYVFGMQKKILLIAKEFLDAFKKVLEDENVGLTCIINEDQVNQIVIDTVEDLKRIVDFHPINKPNLIKEISYIAFWWLKRKPLFIPFDIFKMPSEVDEKTKLRLLFINEFVLVSYISSGLFDLEKVKCTLCKPEQFEYEWKCARELLFYHLVYRVDSPRNIEQFLIGTTLHPVWEPVCTFWDDEN